jgi:tRNA pseudouridine32 synthase/23S rRNA pseudouridine746 synthase
MIGKRVSSSVYEIIDDQPEFVVIYKKPGVSFHSETGEPGLFEQVKQQGQFVQLFPVHRLDKITSGILVMAKTAAANQALCHQFEQRQTEKFYLALSQKKPTKKEGLIKGDMQAARRGAWMLTKTQQNPAITQFFSKGVGDGRRLFVLRPHTGKTHQIRVAMKSLGSPIMGDSLYGDAAQQADMDRAYLHAFSLAFQLSGTPYRYTCLPREGQWFVDELFVAAMGEYLQPWNLPWPRVAGSTS